MMGPKVTILGGNHRYMEVGVPMSQATSKLPMSDPDLTIGDDVWLGALSLVLPGASIGRRAIVAAGSVVVDPVLPYTIVAGVPARLVRDRFTLAEAEAHEHQLFGAEKVNLDHLKAR